MSETVWNLFVELRKELVEAQKIRAQVMGFKVTFVSAVVGLVAANLDKLDSALLAIPALAAICFDFLICSYSFSVKRIGNYTRKYIEPVLKKSSDLPEDFLMWQEFLTQPKTRQRLSLYGNLGFTMLVSGLALIALWSSPRPVLSYVLTAAIAVFFVMDIMAHREHRRLGKIWVNRNIELEH